MPERKYYPDCLICERIRLIKTGQNPYFVKELKSGYVVLGDYQFFRGYTLLLSKAHVSELHQLPVVARKRFLWEMGLVAQAVFMAFKPARLNYELLGNTDRHLHWHIFPRHKNDPKPKRTVWNIPKTIRFASAAKPGDKELYRLGQKLRKELEKLI